MRNGNQFFILFIFISSLSSRTDKGASDKAETLEHGALLQLAKGSFVKDSTWTE